MTQEKVYIIEDFKTKNVYKIVATNSADAIKFVEKITENWSMVGVEDLECNIEKILISKSILIDDLKSKGWGENEINVILKAIQNEKKIRTIN